MKYQRVLKKRQWQPHKIQRNTNEIQTKPTKNLWAPKGTKEKPMKSKVKKHQRKPKEDLMKTKEN